MKNKIRVFFQLLIVALILYVAIKPMFVPSYLANFEAYCPLGGISSLMSKLNLGSMSCTMSEVQVMMGIGLLVGVIIVGKLFCSYLCPIGTITEWLGKIGEKFKMRWEISKPVDRVLRSLKYVLLFLTIYFTMTSSELFCKEFEPYFFTANGFSNSDIVLFYAIPALVITILGSIFFRLFWCKYLCPLSALSNIFLNVLPVAAVIILYVVLNAVGVKIGLVWLLIAITVIGLLTETVFMKSVVLPFAKIVRNTDTCNDCKLCEIKCPQGIKLTEYTTINHVDCNLCSDCIHACSVKNSITINNKKSTKYLAPAATLVLILVSLGFSTRLEFTTLSEKWGGYDKVANVGEFTMENLKSVKCFGSASALKNQLKKVDGIIGLDAYAATHHVLVYYDAQKLTAEKVKEAIFTPSKQKVSNLKNAKIDSLVIYRVGIYELFDAYDFAYLTTALRANKGIYGYDSMFGEPVQVNVYYNPAVTNPEEIDKAILVDKIQMKKGEGTETVPLKFKIHEAGIVSGSISKSDYEKLMFKNYDEEFDDYGTYSIDKLSVLIYDMPEADHPLLRRKLPYLASHLSKIKGIVRLSTIYDDGPKCLVYFDPSQTTVQEVKRQLSNPTLIVTFTNKGDQNEPNPFKSDPSKGKVVKTSDIPEVKKSL